MLTLLLVLFGPIVALLISFWLLRRAPHWFVQSWLHQVLREIYLRLSLGRSIDAVFTVVASGTAYLNASRLNQQPDLQSLARILFGALIVLTLLRVAISLASGDSPERHRSTAVLECLQLLHKQVFHSADHFRLTFFIRDPLLRQGWKHNEAILIPYKRRSPTGGNSAAFNSKVYYRLDSQAVTAVAWQRPGGMQDSLKANNLKAFVNSFPDFHGREDLEQYYIRHLGIDSEIISRISPHMNRVVEILSFPLTDSAGRVFGLVSVDSTARFRLRSPKDPHAFDGTQEIDGVHLSSCLMASQALLSKVGLPT